MAEPVAGRPASPGASAPARADGRKAQRPSDRVSVALLSLAAFLAILAALGAQLGGSASRHRQPHVVVLRRIYRTTVVERVVPAGKQAGPGGTSVSQSVSGSGAVASTSAPVTRSS